MTAAMTQLGTTTTATATSAADEKLRDASARLVGNVFYGTLLRQMRDSSLNGKYGHGGRGEEAFQAQLDQHFAEEAGKAGQNSLTEAIFRQFRDQAQAVERFNIDQQTRMQELQRQVNQQTTPSEEDLVW